jgi:hypothetical protein
MAADNSIDSAKYIGRDYFSYELLFTGIAPGISQNQSIQCEVNSDFAWQKGVFFADVAAAGQTVQTQVVPLCTVLIQDSGSNRQLQNIASPLPNLFGLGYSPFILPFPRVFVARSNISIQLSNFDAAQTYNIRLSFIGTKLFLKS